MKKLILLLIATTFTFIGCQNKDKNAASGDAAFIKLSEEFLDGYLGWRPQYGVSLGYHQYDGKITDYSKTSLDAEVSRLKEFDKKLSEIDSVSLSTKKQYDWKILSSNIKREIFTFENLKVYTS